MNFNFWNATQVCAQNNSSHMLYFNVMKTIAIHLHPPALSVHNVKDTNEYHCQVSVTRTVNIINGKSYYSHYKCGYCTIHDSYYKTTLFCLQCSQKEDRIVWMCKTCFTKAHEPKKVKKKMIESGAKRAWQNKF